jgi:hypothetical protein
VPKCFVRSPAAARPQPGRAGGRPVAAAPGRDAEGRALSDGELRDGELRDELVTLLVAGHETTAAALAWALDELADARAVQERLASGEDGLAEAVVTETLRLHAPVPLGALWRGIVLVPRRGGRLVAMART